MNREGKNKERNRNVGRKKGEKGIKKKLNIEERGRERKKIIQRGVNKNIKIEMGKVKERQRGGKIKKEIEK